MPLRSAYGLTDTQLILDSHSKMRCICMFYCCHWSSLYTE